MADASLLDHNTTVVGTMHFNQTESILYPQQSTMDLPKESYNLQQPLVDGFDDDANNCHWSSIVVSTLNISLLTRSIAVFCIILFVANLFAHYCSRKLKSKNCTMPSPPGPTGVPLLGYVPFIGEKSHETFENLAKKYGPIFKIHLGLQPVVFLSDYKLVREALKSSSFTDRPALKVLGQVVRDFGVVNLNGEKWKNQRQFAMRAMRKMGLARTGPNRSKAEANISRMINEMVDDVKSTDGAPVNLGNHLSICIGRIVLKTMWNFDLPIDDREHKANLDRAEAGFKTSLTNLVNYFPILRYATSVRKDLKSIKESHRLTHEFFAKLIAAHENRGETSEKTMVDWFIEEMNRKTTYYDRIQLLSLLSEIYSAGMETTKTTLMWMIFYVTLNQDVQKKVHEELDSILDDSTNPCLDDAEHLPYTNAVIMETQRLATILPSGLIHVATEDTSIGGYFIEKGTEVIGHQWTLHHDEKLWKSPHTFDPTNFLSDDGCLIKPPYFIPFATGRRMCLGQDLAVKDLFLIFSTLMHHFSFTFEGCTVPSTEPEIGVTLSPKPFEVRAKPRFGQH